MCMISIDIYIYCIILYVHTFDSYFFATVHHIDETPISWKPQIAPNKTNGKKKR